MKTSVVFFILFLAVVRAQFNPFFNYGGFSGGEQYAASLENAPVGLYDKKNYGRQGLGPSGGGSDITGASLGGAKVGLYGKEHPGAGPKNINTWLDSPWPTSFPFHWANLSAFLISRSPACPAAEES